MKKSTEPDVLALLNEAFSLEYNDVFLYLREADIFRSAKVKKTEVAKMFEEFSLEEMRHADQLSVLILTIDGSAHWEFKPLTYSDKLQDVLRVHSEAEAHAYFLYGRILKCLTDPAARATIERIRASEKKHLALLIDLYKDLTGVPPPQMESSGYEYLDTPEEV